MLLTAKTHQISLFLNLAYRMCRERKLVPIIYLSNQKYA